MKRFKIDARTGSWRPFGLFVRRRCWHSWFTGLWRWVEVESFETREEAIVHYGKIKDLPEYLD